MQKIKITELISRPKGTRLTLPEIHERLGTQDQYRIILNRMLRQMAKYVKDAVIPRLTEFRLTNDDDINTASYRAIAEDLSQEAASLSAALIEIEAARHTARFIQTVEQSIGVDLRTVVRDLDLTDALDDANRKGASLIKSMTDDNIKNVERIVLDAKVNGSSIRQVREQLQAQFKLSRVRSDLIATDQTQKLNASLNKLRQQQIGVEAYEWRTSADERVRSLHRRLDGNVYEWDEQTGAEGGQEPGQPIRCRCTAKAIIEF